MQELQLQELLDVGIGGKSTPDNNEKYLKKLERELELEEKMHTAGVLRFKKETERAKGKEREHTTAYGLQMLQAAIDPVAQGIKEYVEKSFSGTRGRIDKAAHLLKDVDENAAAYLALRSVLDSITLQHTLTKAATRIAGCIEDQKRFTEFELKCEPLYAVVKKSIKHKTSYIHKHLIMTRYMNKAEVHWSKWKIEDKVHLGTTLVNIIVKQTGYIQVVEHRKGRTNTPKFIEATPKTMKWIEDKSAKSSLLNPLFYSTIISPHRWLHPFKGGYHSPLIRQMTLIKTRNQNFLSEISNRVDEMKTVYDSTNALQDTSWSINKSVLQVMETFYNQNTPIGKIPPTENVPLPPKPTSITDKKKFQEWLKKNRESWVKWKHKASKVHEFNARIVSKRIQFKKIIELAKLFELEPEIYFPHQLDFRGRAYPIPMFMNPQGVEYARALLQFSKGERMGNNPESGKWLAIHGANQYGEDKCSLEERVEWVKKNEEFILESARNPLNHDFWKSADKPFCFLGFCFEWLGFKENGESHLTHIPVSVDGSCNGLQVFSLLLKDEVGGAATNLIPSDKPQDIYGIVADRCIAALKKETSNELYKPKCRWTRKEIAQEWLRIGVDRKLCKRPVMVVPYSGTLYSCRGYIEDYLREDLKGNHSWGDDVFYPTNFLAQIMWRQIDSTVVKAREAMNWLQQVSRLAALEDLPVTWSTPSGFVVLQQYREVRSRRIETKLGEGIVKLSISEDTNRLNRRRQRSGISPNFVHSLDSAAMALVTCKMKSQGVHHFAMIHDSYGVHATNVEKLSKCLRQVFVEMFKEDLLGKFRDEIYAMLSTRNQAKMPPLPKKGNLNLEQVLESDYFFA